MISDTTFNCIKEHYDLDELRAEQDLDREHTSPDGKHTEYDYKVFVRKGDLKFEFYTAVHWRSHVTEVPWYEVWTRVFVGKRVYTYSIDHAADQEYLMHMVIEGLEEGKDDDETDEIRRYMRSRKY